MTADEKTMTANEKAITNVKDLLKRARDEGIEFGNYSLSSFPSSEYHFIHMLASDISADTLALNKLVCSHALMQHIDKFHSCNSAHEIVHDGVCGPTLLGRGVLGVQVIEEEPNVFYIYVVF